jgi:hypothetical protein
MGKVGACNSNQSPNATILKEINYMQLVTRIGAGLPSRLSILVCPETKQRVWQDI